MFDAPQHPLAGNTRSGSCRADRCAHDCRRASRTLMRCRHVSGGWLVRRRPPGAAAPDGTSSGAASSVAGRRREAIALRVSEAWRTIPHFAVSRDIDGSAAVAALKALRGERPDATMTDLLLHAFAPAADWLHTTTGFTSTPDPHQATSVSR